MLPKLITILGPTATGKTRLAALLCSRFGGEIISCDSRQFYRGMDIGTGKDYQDYIVDGDKIPVHLIDFLNPDQDYDVFHFQNDFKRTFEQINARGNVPFLVGGSGMYLSAILQKYRFAQVDFSGCRYSELAAFPDAVLRDMLFKISPNLHNTTDSTDRERMIKAIIVAEGGQSSQSNTEDFTPLVIGINPGREVVLEQIARRLKVRLETGMIKEVDDLLAAGIPPERLNFFGLEYRYITFYLTGELALSEMEEKLRYAINNFAKRQMTWFRRMEKQGLKINWLHEPYEDEGAAFISEFIAGGK